MPCHCSGKGSWKFCSEYESGLAAAKSNAQQQWSCQNDYLTTMSLEGWLHNPENFEAQIHMIDDMMRPQHHYLWEKINRRLQAYSGLRNNASQNAPAPGNSAPDEIQKGRDLKNTHAADTLNTNGVRFNNRSLYPDPVRRRLSPMILTISHSEFNL